VKHDVAGPGLRVYRAAPLVTRIVWRREKGTGERKDGAALHPWFLKQSSISLIGLLAGTELAAMTSFSSLRR